MCTKEPFGYRVIHRLFFKFIMKLYYLNFKLKQIKIRQKEIKNRKFTSESCIQNEHEKCSNNIRIKIESKTLKKIQDFILLYLKR